MADQTLYPTSEIPILLSNQTTTPRNFVEEDEPLDEFWPITTQCAKKRRLSVNQVQFLEKIFQTETKLEPERKTQLAQELGLQPRQVVIWFQNRRARFKTKQIEKDYKSLKTRYQKLKSDYDNLVTQNEKLKTEVEKLKGKSVDSSENLNSSTMAAAEADSSRGIQPEVSDDEENFSGNLLLPICFPKLETCYYDDSLIGFRIEDPPLGFWPY